MTIARRRAATVAAVVLLPLGVWQAASFAATGSNGTGNGGNGNGNGGSSGGTSSPGKALTTLVVGSAPVAPGRAGSVSVRVTNPNNQAAVITALSGTVTGVSSGNRPGLQCRKEWIVLGSFAGSQPIGANGSTVVTVPVTFTDLSATNQDNCKGVTYTFSFTVTGQQA